MCALRFAEGYIKPREVRQFSSSARKRASIRALGSITYLQKYYASGGAVCEGFLNEDHIELTKASFVHTLSPRSGLMAPSPEILLKSCHQDIQSVLEVWGIISYPSPSAHASNGQEQALDSPVSVDENDSSRQLGHAKDSSSSSLNTQQQRRYDSVSIDLLALLESSTKAISSIRQFSMHAPVLSPTALTLHRQAALSVIEMLSILEQENRVMDSDEESNHPEGYCYARLSFGDLEEERSEMKRYLTVVQEQLFRPQAERIETQLEQLLVSDQSRTNLDKEESRGDGSKSTGGLPMWMEDQAWSDEEDGPSIERCHAFLEFFRPATRPAIPSPSVDKYGFLEALSDGYVMCKVFNAFVCLTNMPFGLVDKIHEDTKRTWRGADNWRFLIQACKFRLDFKVADGSFKPIEMVKQTDLGREQIQNWVKLIVQRGIQEAKETLEAKSRPSPLPVDPTLELHF